MNKSVQQYNGNKKLVEPLTAEQIKKIIKR